MYNLFEIIKDIKYFAIDEVGNIIGNSLNQIVDVNRKINILINDGALQEIYYRKPYFFVNDIFGNGILITKDSFKRLDGFYIVDTLNSKELLVDNNNSETLIFNIENSTWNKFLDYSIFRYLKYNNNFFSFNSRNISNNKHFAYNSFWQYSLTSFGKWRLNNEIKDYEVESFIGVWQNTLLVAISDDNILALDVETGQLLQRLELRKILDPKIKVGNGGYSMHLDEENDRIVWLSYSALVHIDLKSFNVKLIKDFYNVPKELLWAFNTSTYYKGQLYFTGELGLQSIVPTRVGIMDVETGDVLWQVQLQKTKGLTKAPQISNNKMYVLALSGDLYIFEKEDE